MTTAILICNWKHRCWDVFGIGLVHTIVSWPHVEVRGIFPEISTRDLPFSYMSLSSTRDT